MRFLFLEVRCLFYFIIKNQNLKSIDKKCTILKTFRVQNYFSLKDETPLALQANVVYLFEGSCDKNQTYISKTKSHLATRVKENFQ